MSSKPIWAGELQSHPATSIIHLARAARLVCYDMLSSHSVFTASSMVTGGMRRLLLLPIKHWWSPSLLLNARCQRIRYCAIGLADPKQTRARGAFWGMPSERCLVRGGELGLFTISLCAKWSHLRLAVTFVGLFKVYFHSRTHSTSIYFALDRCSIYIPRPYWAVCVEKLIEFFFYQLSLFKLVRPEVIFHLCWVHQWGNRKSDWSGLWISDLIMKSISCRALTIGVGSGNGCLDWCHFHHQY